MTKPIHKPDFALDPFIVICGCTRQAGVEKLTGTERDIDCDGKLFVARPLHELTADLPGCGLVKAHELKFMFFLKQLLQYGIHIRIPSRL
jgi:hypothetical protein